MSKIILNLAISLDGYISDLDGGFDWIVGHGENEKDASEAFDFIKFLEGIDTIVMGSKSYEDCVLSGLTTFDDKKIIVATSRKLEKRENVEFVDDDICKHILNIKKQGGKDIWLFGGALLSDIFIKEDIIDQYMIAVIPTILGDGRRLFRGGYPKIDLYLDKHIVSDGTAVLIYSKRNVKDR